MVEHARPDNDGPVDDGSMPDLAPATLAVWAGEEASSCRARPRCRSSTAPRTATRTWTTWLDVALGQRAGPHLQPQHQPDRTTPSRRRCACSRAERRPPASPPAWPPSATPCSRCLSRATGWSRSRTPTAAPTSCSSSFCPRFGVEVDALRHDRPRGRSRRPIARGCTLLYLETPTNPTLKVLDIARLAAAGHEAGAVVVADNTFATPINQNPLALGVDLVIAQRHQVSGRPRRRAGRGRLRRPRAGRARSTTTGRSPAPRSTPWPPTCCIRGMKTLALRVGRQNESALRIARWLETQPAVTAVHYPGLETHAGHDIARRQMRGFGGVLSFMLEGGFDAVRRVLPRLRLAHRAANLGAVETIAGPPATTSHVECTRRGARGHGHPRGPRSATPWASKTPAT